MNRPLAIAAIAEAGTGIGLIAVPSVVGQFLLGEELTGVAEVVARLAGVALVSLGIACWPGKMPAPSRVCGMIAYTALAGTYLAVLGSRHEYVGPLLWPAAVVHALLIFLLIRTAKPASANKPRAGSGG